MTLCDEYSRSAMFPAIQNRRAAVCVVLAISSVITGLLIGLLLPMYRGLVHLFWLTILCNTFIPIAPHEPVILLYGTLYPPWVVAVCAGTATSIIELVNYCILAPLLNLRRIGTFREKRFYQRAEHYFSKFPFSSLLFSGFAPVPFVPFRMLAVTTKYSVKKFVLAVFLGRVPRFYLLALMGKALDVPTWVHGIILVLAFSIVLTRKLAEYRRKVVIRRRRDGVR